MAQTAAQRRASQAVAKWLASREVNTAWLVRQTGLDAGTIGDFLNGNRWPKYKTQGAIEKALEWPAGTLTTIADGADVADSLFAVGGATEDDGFVAAPGPAQVGGISDTEVLQVLDNMQRELDRLRRRLEGGSSAP